jgi:hypothetical protein
MRVTIKHETVERKKGLFSKQSLPAVTVHVEFSEEEKHIINSSDLKEAVLVERPVPPDADQKYAAQHPEDHWVFHLRVDHLLKGPNTFCFPATGAARDYEEEVKDALRRLKDHIEHNAPQENKSTSFEL